MELKSLGSSVTFQSHCCQQIALFTISKAQKLKGTGILQLPNGCTLQVIDKDGRVTKLKGQPQNTVITPSDILFNQSDNMLTVHRVCPYRLGAVSQLLSNRVCVSLFDILCKSPHVFVCVCVCILSVYVSLCPFLSVLNE